MDSSFDSELFVQKLKYHRENLGLSLRKAAKQCNIPVATYHRAERGRVVTIDTFFNCCDWMMLPANYFKKKPKTASKKKLTLAKTE